jgi:hypothetical protein
MRRLLFESVSVTYTSGVENDGRRSGDIRRGSAPRNGGGRTSKMASAGRDDASGRIRFGVLDYPRIVVVSPFRPIGAGYLRGGLHAWNEIRRSPLQHGARYAIARALARHWLVAGPPVGTCLRHHLARTHRIGPNAHFRTQISGQLPTHSPE